MQWWCCRRWRGEGGGVGGPRNGEGGGVGGLRNDEGSDSGAVEGGLVRVCVCVCVLSMCIRTHAE